MIAKSLLGTWGPAFIGVANHLWQSTVFIFPIWLLTFAFRNNHARTRYWLWFAASMKFLLPFYLLVLLGSHLTWLHRVPLKSEAKANAASSNFLVEQISQPFTLSGPESPVAESIGRSSIAIRMSALLGPIPTLSAILVVAWLSGFLTVMGLWFFRRWKIGAAIQNALPLHDGREVEALRRMEHLGALRRNIKILSLPASTEPGIFGLLRPVLLWPNAITARLDDAHLEAVLAHEIAHVRRRDNLTAAIHMLVEAIFWFHPMVWWLEARLVVERENACDEEVLLVLREPGIYAESILKVCKFSVESTPACVSGITGADLKKRIVQIMRGSAARKLSLGGKLLLVFAASLTAITPVTLGLWHRPAALAQTVQPTGQARVATEKEQRMAADASPAFLVATIKPSDPDSASRGWGFPTEGRHVSAVNATVENIMEVAYGIHTKQIVGAPVWLSKDRYNINGIPDVAGVPDFIQKREMYQKLLADRFHLVFHRETREMPIYAITIAKGGPILTPANPNETHINTGNSGGGGQRTLKFTNISMSDFSLNMNFYEDRPVIDQTSLPGRYDFTLRWTDDLSRENETGAPPSLFTAIREQLGLRVNAVKGPAEVFVIDSVERPSVN
jgi:bla regulator protein BlaR1